MELVDWINGRLSELLDFPVPQDLTQYIVAIENNRDLEEYLCTLLNFSDPKHRQFLNELIHKRQSVLQGSATSNSADLQRYKKSEVDEVYVQPKQNDKKKRNKGQPQNDIQNVQKETPKLQDHEEKKKKTKFVNLYSQEGQMRDVIMLKGRHRCECQATKHKLINNCLECGRVVCEQEGSGPCFFCNNMVCTQEERMILDSSTKESSALYKKLVGREKHGLDAALQQRNRLLEFDRTSEKRTRVIDDESDYYSSNSVWLSPAEREKVKKLEDEMHAQRHASRLEKKMTLDFAGRQVIEDDAPEIDMDKLLLEDDDSSLNMFYENGGDVGYDTTLHPRMMCEKPVFQEQGHPESIRLRKSDTHKDHSTISRIQDRGFLEMSDNGSCLSMHQPWASLLVAGIKMHEGRVWYHSHRGRLWIASTAKPPLVDDIKHMEHMYRVLKNEKLKFPANYPTGCLLGCVNVVDCLPQEDYRNQFPEGESDSPFVFICEEPKELPIKFPIQGKHKIYKLDKKIHEAAQKAVDRLARLRADRARNMEADS